MWCVERFVTILQIKKLQKKKKKRWRRVITFSEVPG